MTIRCDFLAIQHDGLDIVFTDAAIEHALDRVNPVYELQFESVKQLFNFPTKDGACLHSAPELTASPYSIFAPASAIIWL
jgi:hypothetical protein